MEILVQRLDADVALPARAHRGDAGLDLHAAEDVSLKPGERASVGTGIALAIPVAFGLAETAELVHVPVPLPWQLTALASGVTMGMALLSGLLALRSLRLAEPAALLR